MGVGTNPQGNPEAWIAYLGSPDAPVPGDFNDDQLVNAADYVAWRKNGGPQTEYQAWLTNFGHGQSQTTGDFNLDGQINAADYVALRKTGGSHQYYNLWRTHFGEPASAGALSHLAPSDSRAANSTVPEPSTFVFLFLSCAPFFAGRPMR
jgi:hypothetical protein